MLSLRAYVAVRFVPCTNYRPDRWSVNIDGFPRAFYSCSAAPDHVSGLDSAHWAALQELKKQGLSWALVSGTFVRNVGYVFTAG